MPAASVGVCTSTRRRRRAFRARSKLATVLALSLTGCLSSLALPPASWAIPPTSPTETTDAPAPADPALTIGTAATDTFGGWLPDGVTLSPFDVSNPVIALLDPLLLKAIQDATRAAAADGVELRITSGWRSTGFQQRLFDDGVRTYGSVDIARQFVASPEVSKHVTGQAVDIGPVDADLWMIRNGPRFGLCQIYANEIWHFELVADEQGRCPPLKPNAAG
ncbi:M15 family metallopeptidase [Mycobacterium sp.]|uniref:M15 family metallopeptidase n=1 Tax=Mycobacterium sp. TaxID=1785 RepID=UPI002DA64D30|nr:M15 family metallopeptidase [Mycobacterium sp.]